MSSNTYWQRREAEALKHRITDEKEYDRQIKRIYSNMLDNCQKEINAFYGKYAAKEGITIAEAKKRVKKADIAEFERKAARYVRDKDFSAKANEEMRLYNAMMQINRLEMLKANIGLEMIAGHDELEKFMGGILKGRTEDELKRQAGILGKTVLNNAAKADAIVNASFHNATFSDRIWMYQDLLKDELDKALQSGLIQGKNPRVLARDIKAKFNASTFHAERLMRTELARVQTEAQKQSFVRNGYEQYEFIVNGGCCDICAGLSGKHFKVAKMMPGENAPPMHPHCRCSTAAWVDSKDYEGWLNYLDSGGTTAEWDKMTAAEKRKYKQGLTNNSKSDIMQPKFQAAKTLKEATQRMSAALGVEQVSLGRMPIELANQYLEGVERFMADFPMLKGYYNQVGTKTGAPGIMGLNSLRGEYVENRTKLKLECGLQLKSTSSLDKLLASYADDVKRGGSYANECPLSTAIHELVHGIDHAITFKKYGGYDENGLGTIAAKDWNSAKAGVSQGIIKQVREEMFGAQYGREVADQTRYLGSYARTSSKEELAEAISYEYVSKSNPYSARILELFKEKVKGAFGNETD